MAESPTAAATGTQTAVIGTEHSLFTSSGAGVFSYHVDTINMAAGDVLELRCYQMILTSGTTRVLEVMRVSDAQPTDSLIIAFDPIGNDLSDSGAIKYTLKQTAGTGRAFPYKILQY